MLSVERPPSAPLYLRYSFVITNSNITVLLFWQSPTSGADVTGYRVTCSRAGSNWYTDRRTMLTTTLPSVSVVVVDDLSVCQHLHLVCFVVVEGCKVLR